MLHESDAVEPEEVDDVQSEEQETGRRDRGEGERNRELRE